LDEEQGAQVTVYHRGKLIVDARAGLAEAGTGQPVEAETLFPVFSTTKGIMATLVHLLAERGQLDYDTPIAHYWPEFAENGKEGISVRHALAHTSGLPEMPPDTDPARLYDWDAMCRAIAHLRPLSPPGEKTVYHAVTFGWILGEVVRRIDGRSVQAFLEAEISRPLGFNSVFIGIPAELEPAVAFLEEVPEPVENSLGATIAPCMFPLGQWMNRPEARRACIPGSNGIMNARGIARTYAALLPGGVDGVELLSPERVAQAMEIHTSPEDLKRGEQRRGLGYTLHEGGSPTGFGHGGYGGSLGYADPRHHLAVGITRNRFSPHNLSGQVTDLLRQALRITPSSTS
jgi:CubicO group peptidase (beta-lactamase class C family)